MISREVEKSNVHCPHDIGELSTNGLKLLEFSSEVNLIFFTTLYH